MKFESLNDEKFNLSKLTKSEARFILGGERIVTARTTGGRVTETAEEVCTSPGGGAQFDGVRTLTSAVVRTLTP